MSILGTNTDVYIQTCSTESANYIAAKIPKKLPFGRAPPNPLVNWGGYRPSPKPRPPTFQPWLRPCSGTETCKWQSGRWRGALETATGWYGMNNIRTSSNYDGDSRHSGDAPNATRQGRAGPRRAHSRALSSMPATSRAKQNRSRQRAEPLTNPQPLRHRSPAGSRNRQPRRPPTNHCSVIMHHYNGGELLMTDVNDTPAIVGVNTPHTHTHTHSY